MNKGTDYEIKVMNRVKLMLNQEELGISPRQAKTSHKPAYYSRDRQKDITFDVSIEVCRKGSETPHWIWIWECKNYSHKVPVDDIEEFHAKLNQVGADKAKGTVISPAKFDKGAYEFARSKGIGLWRWIPDRAMIFRLDADSDSWSDERIYFGLIEDITSGFPDDNFVFTLTTNGNLTRVLSEMIVQEFLDVDMNTV